MTLAAYDRSRSGHWESAHGAVLPEVDPTDETALDAHNATQPERRLLLAILADAIVRVRQLATAPRHAAIELREAERWIRSDDREWPCSFVNVCDALDIAYGPLRRAVLAWRRTSPGGAVTRRALLVKPKRRRHAVAVVPPCPGAVAAEPACSDAAAVVAACSPLDAAPSASAAPVPSAAPAPPAAAAPTAASSSPASASA